MRGTRGSRVIIEGGLGGAESLLRGTRGSRVIILSELYIQYIMSVSCGLTIKILQNSAVTTSNISEGVPTPPPPPPPPVKGGFMGGTPKGVCF